MNERLNVLISELDKLHHRLELSKTVTAEYFEPGMMEYLDKSEGTYDPLNGEIIIRFEAKGTRYDGRTEIIEKMKIGDTIAVLRDRDNPYNSNNFTLENGSGSNVGNMPMELCNAIAPLYDSEELVFENAFASFVDPITHRSRHAKQAMLFVEIHCRVYL